MSDKAKIQRKTGNGKICESIHAFFWVSYETAGADGDTVFEVLCFFFIIFSIFSIFEFFSISETNLFL
jgi:hypothetical protein